MNWVDAVRLTKMRPGKKKMVNIGKRVIMISELDGFFIATEGLCRHMRWPLSWGAKVKDGCIRCPLHQTTHSIEDGRLLEWSPFPLFPPYGKLVGLLSKKKDLEIFETRVQGDFVQVRS